MANIQAITGNIVTIKVDAIVNAANTSLLGGGGVDGAIQRAAGPGLLSECGRLNGCSTGQTKVTGAYQLESKCIIHTVGPIWQGGSHHEAKLLASCYRNCIHEATKRNLRSIAFPAISTGAYGYPVRSATEIAVQTVSSSLVNSDLQVIFICFNDEICEIYQQIIECLVD